MTCHKPLPHPGTRATIGVVGRLLVAALPPSSPPKSGRGLGTRFAASGSRPRDLPGVNSNCARGAALCGHRPTVLAGTRTETTRPRRIVRVAPNASRSRRFGAPATSAAGERPGPRVGGESGRAGAREARRPVAAGSRAWHRRALGCGKRAREPTSPRPHASLAPARPLSPPAPRPLSLSSGTSAGQAHLGDPAPLRVARPSPTLRQLERARQASDPALASAARGPKRARTRRCGFAGAVAAGAWLRRARPRTHLAAPARVLARAPPVLRQL